MKSKALLNVTRMMFGIVLCLVCFVVCRMDAKALTLEFDETNQEIIVSGVPATDDKYNYSVNGYLKYGDERIESFCYGTAAIGYDIPDAQAYIFSYSDKEFLLPCSGTYVMTAWIETREVSTWADLGKSERTTLEFYYKKSDESTNWGPGLPETMIEDWEIAELQGKNKDMVVSGGNEEYPYTWTINGEDIYAVPGEDEKVDLQILSMDARFDAYIPGNEITNIQLDIAHSGDFGFTARLDYTLGAQHAGRYANLFYVLGPGKYEFVQSCQIDANGVATFLLNHASSYFVVIRDEAYTGEAIVEPTPVPTAAPTPEPTPEPTPAPTEAPVAESSEAGTEKVDTDNGETAVTGNAGKADKVAANVESAGGNGTIGTWGIVGIVAVMSAVVAAVAGYLVKKRKENGNDK